MRARLSSRGYLISHVGQLVFHMLCYSAWPAVWKDEVASLCCKNHMVGFTFPDGKQLCNGGRNCLLLTWEKIGWGGWRGEGGQEKKLCHTNYANSMSHCEIPLQKRKRMKRGRKKRKAVIVRIEIKRSGSNFSYHLRHSLCRKSLCLHPTCPWATVSFLSAPPCPRGLAGWV